MTAAGRWRRAALVVPVLIAAVALVVAAFPYGLARGVATRVLSERFGRPVTIARLERVDGFGFTPTLRVVGLRVPQAAWAGRGDLIRIARAEATVAVLPLLLGRFRPRDVRIDGVALVLVRRRDGTTSWSRPGDRGAGGGPPHPGALRIGDGRVTYRDARRDRSAELRFTADPASGVRVAGTGRVRGTPVTIAARGAAVGGAGPWPFRVAITGTQMRMAASGTMDRPLDTGAMSLSVTARATDLRLIDAIIEAGLFGTRPVALAARVRHDAARWTVDGLRGTIGRSDLSGRVRVDKVDGRSRIEGTIASRRFDVGDFSSAQGRAAGRALAARIGPRVVPDTRIDLGAVGRTDGRIAFRLGAVLSDGAPTGITQASGTLSIDRRLVRLVPRATAFGGRLHGGVTIDQRGGRRVPRLSIDLSVDGADLGRITGGGAPGWSGRSAIRARLAGRGDTIRAAVARSDGRLALVARDGRLPGRYAAAFAFDAGRALLGGDGDPATLRCLVAAFRVRGGIGQAAPVIVDTSASQLRGTGTLSFPDERLAIRLTGAPKRAALLRVPGSVTLGGTLGAPAVIVPPGTRSAGNILKAIGRAITGRSGPVARDADCAGLAAAALR